MYINLATQNVIISNSILFKFLPFACYLYIIIFLNVKQSRGIRQFLSTQIKQQQKNHGLICLRFK